MTKFQQEQLGLVAVHAVCTKMNAVWRPTPTTDLGIDGQIEFLEPASMVSTGKILSVQIKSGPSYFAAEAEDFVPFYPKLAHRRYWSSLKHPVFLILHEGDRDATFFELIRPHLQVGHGPIKVSKSNRLCAAARDQLIEIHDAEFSHRRDTLPTETILRDFQLLRLCPAGPDADRTNSAEFTISGIHFLLASTNSENGYPGGPYFELRGQRLNAAFEAIDRSDRMGNFVI